MNKNRKGILLTSDFELAIHPVRDASGMIISGMVVGNSIDQDAVIVLKLRPGDLKEDPILGPGLTRFIRGKFNQSSIDQTLKLHLSRVGIDYDDYRDRLQETIN